ncbi:MAG: DNA repair protein RadC [Proteobacteria bacterium]|nr:DNA repair protein RadC [Pseudomonadota bacterium]
MPREKLGAYGAAALSDEELLAVMLGSGCKGKDVFNLARELVEIIDLQNGEICLESLSKVSGLGSSKSSLIAAAFEFVRRRIRPYGVKVTKAEDVLPLISHLAERKQEHFISISLNGANEVIKSRVVTVGLVNSSQIHPREVFALAIKDRATSVIVAHNHPSGNLAPSVEDKSVTEKLKLSAEILGLRFLDHIIFSNRGYFSFKEEGLL